MAILEGLVVPAALEPFVLSPANDFNKGAHFTLRARFLSQASVACFRRSVYARRREPHLGENGTADFSRIVGKIEDMLGP